MQAFSLFFVQFLGGKVSNPFTHVIEYAIWFQPRCLIVSINLNILLRLSENCQNLRSAALGLTLLKGQSCQLVIHGAQND